MAKDFDLEETLNYLTRPKLNRIVQKHIFAYEYGKFSVALKSILNGKLPYGIVLSHLQKGLYSSSGESLKIRKEMPLSGSLPEYMSPMELIRYKEALKETIIAFEDLEERTRWGAYNDFYKTALAVGDEVWDEFFVYKEHLPGEPLTLFQAESASSVLKLLNKAIKRGKYHKFLAVSPLRKDYIDNHNREKTSYFSPYVDPHFDRYENYRKNFVKVIKYFKEDCDFSDNKIKSLFQTYESTFYNTDFLADKNINVIDYTLGFTNETYFSSENLRNFENEISSIVSAINSFNGSTFDKIIPDERKFSYFQSAIIKSAQIERKKSIKQHIPLFKRPETSTVFLTACLDAITHEKIMEENKKRQASSKPPAKSFAQPLQLQSFPKSFTEKAKLVKQSIKEVRKEYNSKVQPTLWDADMRFTEEELPPTQSTQKEPKLNSSQEQSL